ncbi:MAG: MarR family transcriptional regulator [Anaerolineae bacterium]
MGTHYQGTPDEIRALDVYIKLARAADAVTQRINSHLKEDGLTVSQFGVLEALYHLGSMCQTELASKILKSTGNLTLVIDNLERDGLVERQRDSADRRFVSVYLTPTGRQLIDRIFAAARGRCRRDHERPGPGGAGRAGPPVPQAGPGAASVTRNA